jgi:hypothetical protein
MDELSPPAAAPSTGIVVFGDIVVFALNWRFWVF